MRGLPLVDVDRAQLCFVFRPFLKCLSLLRGLFSFGLSPNLSFIGYLLAEEDRNGRAK